MSKIKTGVRLLKSNRRVFLRAVFDKLNKQGLLRWVNDATFLRIDYWLRFGKKLNLKNPQTFNEKLQWLKLYDRRPDYITMVDKISVKEYVAKRIGKEFIIPTLGVWSKPEDIDWDALPNQFVIKWNHDSGSIVICNDKKVFDKDAAIKKLSYGAKVNGFWYGREWPYKGVKPMLLAEKYLDCGNNVRTDLIDYKFFCFEGEPKYIQVIQDRRTRETIDFFDINWNHQEFIGLVDSNSSICHASQIPKKPSNLDEMVIIARKLSKGMQFSRIDLYEVEQKTYFGEITLYPASGLGEFLPGEWNKIIGDMLNLSGVNGGGYKIMIINDLIDMTRVYNELVDYKFMCFNGKVRCCFTCTDRFSGNGLKVTFYDNDWNIMPFERDHPRETTPIQKPYCYEEMKKAAEKLSEGLPFARIDFYEINKQPYFGEITLYPGSGHEAFQPKEWDYTLGSWIKMPNA